MERRGQKSRLCSRWIGWGWRGVSSLNPSESEELAPSCIHLTFALTNCWGKNEQLTFTVLEIKLCEICLWSNIPIWFKIIFAVSDRGCLRKAFDHYLITRIGNFLRNTLLVS